MLCPPCPQHVCKGGGGRAARVRCSQADGTAAHEPKGGGMAHCPSCTPSMCAKQRVGRVRQGRQGKARQGRARGRARQGGVDHTQAGGGCTLPHLHPCLHEKGEGVELGCMQ